MSVSAAVPSSPHDVCPVLTGTLIPPATLRTPDGDAFDLSEAVKQQPSVLVFYRGGW